MDDQLNQTTESGIRSILDVVVVVAEYWKFIVYFAVVVAIVTYVSVWMQPARFEARSVLSLEPKAAGQELLEVIESSVRQHIDLRAIGVALVASDLDSTLEIAAAGPTEEETRKSIDVVTRAVSVSDPAVTTYFENLAERIKLNKQNIIGLQETIADLRALIAKIGGVPGEDGALNPEGLSSSLVALSRQVSDLGVENASLQLKGSALSISSDGIAVTKRALDPFRSSVVAILAGAFVGALLSLVWSELSRGLRNPEAAAKVRRIKAAFGRTTSGKFPGA